MIVKQFKTNLNFLKFINIQSTTLKILKKLMTRHKKQKNNKTNK